MHNWGDEDFDWNALYDSINYIMAFWKRWGRIGSHGVPTHYRRTRAQHRWLRDGKTGLVRKG